MRCVLGFDAGGTKTECVLLDEAGNFLARTFGSGANPVRVGFPEAFVAIKQTADSAISEAGLAHQMISAVCAGIAGTGTPEAAEKMRSGLSAIFATATINVCTDLDIALESAADGPVIVLIGGTGSAAIGRNEMGTVERAGGRGSIVGDEGSAGDIGKQAALAARAWREQHTADSDLGRQLFRQIGAVNAREFERGLLARGQEIYPRLFPVVANAAEAGDATAREILRNAAKQLAALVDSLAQQLGLREQNFRVVKLGGMIGRSSFFDAQLDARLREVAPRAIIEVLAASPAGAAAKMALQMLRRTNSAAVESAKLHG